MRGTFLSPDRARAMPEDSCRLARKFAETVGICVRSQNGRRYASASQLRTGLVSWPLYPFASPFCLWVGSLDLEKVAAAFPAMIRGNREPQDHISTTLTHIIARFRRSAMIGSGISTIFCACLKKRCYESIWDSGEDMRWKNRR